MNKPAEAYALSWHATSLWCLSYYIWDGAIKPLDMLIWWQNEPKCYFVHSDAAMSNVQNIFYQLLALGKARKSCKRETQLMILGFCKPGCFGATVPLKNIHLFYRSLVQQQKVTLKKNIGVKPPWTSHFSNYSWINIKPGKKGKQSLEIWEGCWEGSQVPIVSSLPFVLFRYNLQLCLIQY